MIRGPRSHQGCGRKRLAIGAYRLRTSGRPFPPRNRVNPEVCSGTLAALCVRALAPGLTNERDNRPCREANDRASLPT